MSETDEARRAREAAEDAHRSKVNKVAAVGLVVMLLILIGVVKLFIDHENLQNCVDTGRKDCFNLGAPPRADVRLPTR
jgi:hypothetical protein